MWLQSLSSCYSVNIIYLVSSALRSESKCLHHDTGPLIVQLLQMSKYMYILLMIYTHIYTLIIQNEGTHEDTWET